MDRAGQSILWFLGACLAFSEALIAGVAGAYTDVEGSWVLLFGFLCLAVVLVALLVMFRINPAFITAERGDVVALTLIQQMSRDHGPDIFKRGLYTIVTKPYRFLRFLGLSIQRALMG